jgi:Na+/phosphate symporter
VQRQIEDAMKLQDLALQQQRLGLRDLADKQNVDVRDRQLELMHRQLQIETQVLEQRLAEVEAMHKQLLEQTKAAQKRLAELEKQQQDQRPQEKQERAR